MKNLKLNNGCEIPIIGFGTNKAAAAVKDAIDVGYRHFDCAWFYQNEDEVGAGIKAKIDEGVIKREDLFVTTKLWNNFHEKDKVLPMLKEQLQKLQLDYVDLYLMHWPFGFKVRRWPINGGPSSYSDVDYIETWTMMEEGLKQGLVKSIGVSNFNSEQLQRLLNVAKVKPVVNQIEIHPKFNQKKLIEFCKSNDIVNIGYCPLGQGTPTSAIFDPKVIDIGKKYQKTPAQVVLNYLTSAMNNLKLNNGSDIPIIGLGTYKAIKGEATTAVKDAIDVGYRHFDCAWFYDNEEEVGLGIQAKIDEGVVKREDLFVTTKLWNNFHAKEKVLPMLKEQLQKLKLDYVDLYLIHWPFGFKVRGWPINDGPGAYSDVDYIETWTMMEEGLKQGLVRSIGVSNFNSEQLERLLSVAKIKPVVNQIEIHPKLNQKKLIEFCKSKDIVSVGYCPLGQGTSTSAVFDEKVIEIGKKYQKTAAQIVLNYLVSLGVSVIPKTVNKTRMIENLNIFDFTLDEEDLRYMVSLNTNERICNVMYFKDHKYFPFAIDF
ncbi:hypothetical protein RN001_010929 [Aquatica leii]|uniref:NADP-dependent oxidoreductase domain-containing protein n=1 Tax=Aquatica leii TaxID=1421715 RepID=A0AAN7P8I3_9COLE|nr:hypothetical protein RN001_010929 [Aquatica leii]